MKFLILASILTILIVVVGIQESFSESNNNEKQPKLVLQIDKQYPVIGDQIKFTITNKGPKDAIFNFELYDSDGLIVPLDCFDNPNTKDLLPSDFSRSVTWNQKNCKDFLKSGTFLFNSYLTIDNKLTGFVSALEFEVYNEKQPEIEIPTEIPQIPAKEILPIDEIPINFGDGGYVDDELIPNKNSNPHWEISDFLMSNNGKFEISLNLNAVGDIPTHTAFSCITCRETITVPLNNLDYVDSVVFLEGFSEYREHFFGDSYKISFTDIIALYPINSQIHYVGNYNTTLAFDTLRDPAEFSKFVWDIHWVRSFEDSDGVIYYQWFKDKFSPILDESLNTQGTFTSSNTIPDYTAEPYSYGGMDTAYVDNWFKENILNEFQIDLENNTEIKTGSITVNRLQHAFKVDYSITNGNDVFDIRYPSDITNDVLAIILQSYNNGTVTLSLPLELANSSFCVDNPNYEFGAFYYSQRDPLDFTILSEPDARTVVIEIPFSKYMDEVLVRSNNNYKWDEKPNCSVPENSDYSKLLSPYKQSRNNVDSKDVICKSDFVLVAKNQYSWSYCVTQNTAEKLIERGWMKWN